MTPDPTALLAWYDRHARRLPWRVGPADRAVGVRPDPYAVWLSEVMLQQTTVAAVRPYFEDFLRRWPTVIDLAAAPREEVMSAWAGLGYYSRARNLKAAAEAVAAGGGRFPETSVELKELPGIGDYTAAAIAAIAFDEPVAVVDGNVERVLARLYAVEEPLPEAKPIIRAYQQHLTPPDRAGDYAQAAMDLGATICTPKRPACVLCPWQDPCVARRHGTQELYPKKAPKADRPTRRGAALVVTREDGAVLLRARPDKGLLGGMTEVPGTEWSGTFDRGGDASAIAAALGLGALSDGQMGKIEWRRIAVPVIHVFTHFRLELGVYAAAVPVSSEAPPGFWWSDRTALPDEALPSLMKKVIEAALPGATKGAGPRRRAS